MNAPLAPIASSTVQLQQPRYEAMREAVSLCATIDEAREIQDRAAALAYYARQRDDTEVHVWLQEIKLRAGRRIGEILCDIDRARGGRPGPGTRRCREPSLLSQAIEDAGLRRGPAYQLQEIAGPRDATFRAVADEAAELYYAKARTAQVPATQAGLRAEVISAVHAAMSPGEINRLAKGFARDRQARKAVLRAEREVRLGERTRAAGAQLGTSVYSVIYADPPWRFEVYSEETGMDRAADNHYPTLPTPDICALQVPAAKDAVLFLWATAPMLLDGLAVMEAWGFSYKSHVIWHKPRMIMGYWARGKHELLLIGTRGDVPAPTPGTQFVSVVDALSGAHSAKPAQFADTIARMFPTVPKVELFARAPRQGWDVWGNESDGSEGVAA